MATVSPSAAVAVLDRAVVYAHACLQRARTSSLDLPTPCAGWRLGSLLMHMEDSLIAIGEAADLGRVTVTDEPSAALPDLLVDRLEQRACGTTAAWHRRLTSAPVSVGDLLLGRDTLVFVGALEIAVHGWDVAQATGERLPVPDLLATRLYDVALAVVTEDTRVRRFAEPLATPPRASASDRLLAHLGRRTAVESATG
jgi:uncharacterized protein (TIGR03086 family)